MDKHYILNLNPQANSEWDRCVLRNPLSGERPDLSTEIAKAVSDRAGTYLIKVKLEVEILEQNPISPSNRVELPTAKKSTVLKTERLAS